MSSASPNASPRRAICDLAVMAGLFLAVLGTQCWNGAFEREFGSHPDEAGHLLTGVLAHDYIIGGRWSDPLSFAEEFYLHYPKVAIGHWPPGFYAVEGLWFLVFGVSRPAAILLQGFLAAGLGFGVYRVARRHVPLPLAVGAGFTTVALRPIQENASAVMTELCVSVLVLGAAAAYVRYLRTDRPYRWAVAFGVLASLAILTKGTGLLLALVPGLTVLLTRRFDLLLRGSFWVPVGVVAGLCAPYYWLTLGMQRSGMVHESFNADFVTRALPYYSEQLVTAVGWPLAILAGVGAWNRLGRPVAARADVDPTWAVFGAVVLSVWGFHVVVPCAIEARYLLPAIPGVVLFAADGADVARRRLAAYPGPSAGWVSVVLLLGVGLAVGGRPRPKTADGFGNVLTAVEQRNELDRAVILVSSDPTGEGMLIAEAALRDRRPGRYILRASKVLASDSWIGADYETRYASPSQVRDCLRRLPVGVLAIDTSLGRDEAQPHHRQLLDVVRGYPSEWQLVGRYTVTRFGVRYPGAIEVYTQVGYRDLPPGGIELDMGHMLGRTLRGKVTHR